MKNLRYYIVVLLLLLGVEGAFSASMEVGVPIDKAVNKGIKVIADKAKSWFGTSKGGTKPVSKDQVDKDAKKDEKDKKNGKVIKLKPEKFSMAGKSHTLTFEGSKVMMASVKGSLTSKLASAKKEVEDNRDAEKLKGKAEHVLKSLGGLTNAVNSTTKSLAAAVKSKDAKKTSKAQTSLDRLGGNIGKFGTKYGLKDLTDIVAGGEEVKDIPIKKGDLLKAKYTKGKFLADATLVDKTKKQEEHTFRYAKLNKSVEKNTFSEFKEKWDKGDIEKVNEERRHLIKNRPTHKSGFRATVWANAKKTGVDSKGAFVRDANVEELKIYGELVDDPNAKVGATPRKIYEGDDWDAGHKKESKYSELVDEYIDGDISWDEFLEEYHDPDNYQVEHPSENRSHKHE